MNSYQQPLKMQANASSCYPATASARKSPLQPSCCCKIAPPKADTNLNSSRCPSAESPSTNVVSHSPPKLSQPAAQPTLFCSAPSAAPSGILFPSEIVPKADFSLCARNWDSSQ